MSQRKKTGALVPHLVDEGQIGSQINLAARLLQRAARLRLGEAGAWPGQIPLLLWLLEEQNLIQKELVARTGIEQSTVAEHLDRMERDGLVARERSSDDRRAFRICLTPKGRAVSTDLVDGIKAGVPIFTAGLTTEQMVTFNFVIEQIIENLNSYLRKAKSTTRQSPPRSSDGSPHRRDMSKTEGAKSSSTDTLREESPCSTE